MIVVSSRRNRGEILNQSNFAMLTWATEKLGQQKPPTTL